LIHVTDFEAQRKYPKTQASSSRSPFVFGDDEEL